VIALSVLLLLPTYVIFPSALVLLLVVGLLTFQFVAWLAPARVVLEFVVFAAPPLDVALTIFAVSVVLPEELSEEFPVFVVLI